MDSWEINCFTATRELRIILFSHPILKVATFFFRTTSSSYKDSVFSDKAHRHNAPMLPNQMKNVVWTLSLSNKANDNWQTPITWTTMRSTEKDLMQVKMPEKDIQDTVSRESEVPYPPMLRDTCNGWNSIPKTWSNTFFCSKSSLPIYYYIKSYLIN